MTTPSRILEAAPRSLASGQERNAKIDRILRNVIASVRGVTAGVIVDGDGLVTHAHLNFKGISVDALGATVQVAFGAAHRASEHVQHGDTNLVLLENKEGLVLLAQLQRGFLFALVADPA